MQALMILHIEKNFSNVTLPMRMPAPDGVNSLIAVICTFVRTVHSTNFCPVLLQADRLQPEWCRRNTGQCYGPDDNPNGPPPATSTTTPATTTTESHEQPGSGEATIGGSSSLLLLGVAVSWTLYPSWHHWCNIALKRLLCFWVRRTWTLRLSRNLSRTCETKQALCTRITCGSLTALKEYTESLLSFTPSFSSWTARRWTAQITVLKLLPAMREDVHRCLKKRRYKVKVWRSLCHPRWQKIKYSRWNECVLQRSQRT